MSIDRNCNEIKRRYYGGKTNAKCGRWSQAEKLTFLVGLKKFGKGKWKEIATMIPTRSTVQVKTHAQMVMKRVEAGEDVFEDLEELKTEEQAIPTPDKVVSQHPAVYMNRASCHKAIDSLQEYGALTLMDQGAVMILYQMAKAI